MSDWTEKDVMEYAKLLKSPFEGVGQQPTRQAPPEALRGLARKQPQGKMPRI